MTPSRLSLAVQDGAVTLPDAGRIAVFRPRAGTDLSALPQERVQVVQGFRPDHDALQRAGYDTTTFATGDYALAVVFLPRAKAEAHALIAEAMRVTSGGPVVVDGQKTDGVESVLKDCRKHGAEIVGTLSKAHGKIFVASGGVFTDWAADRNETRLEGGFVTVPGIFSADGVDRGSAALAAALPRELAGRIADLGAGWGFLAHNILTSPKVTECHLIEAEHAALDCARRNVTDPRARFHWADATTFQPESQFDAVVMNPPFHATRMADPALGQAFIQAAAGMIKPGGTVWLVANRHLPYEAALSAAFHEVAEVAGAPSFKVFRLSKPRRKPG
ncbi:MAG: class I SAM-dependent methyltransferase [Paracoccaceae bacterium]